MYWEWCTAKECAGKPTPNSPGPGPSTRGPISGQTWLNDSTIPFCDNSYKICHSIPPPPDEGPASDKWCQDNCNIPNPSPGCFSPAPGLCSCKPINSGAKCDSSCIGESGTCPSACKDCWLCNAVGGDNTGKYCTCNTIINSKDICDKYNGKWCKG